MKKILSFSIAAFFITVITFTSATAVKAQNPENTQKRLQKRQAFELLINKAERQNQIRVIVGLEMDFQSEGKLSRQQVAAQRGKIKENQERFKNRLQFLRADDVEQFKSIPFIAFETDAASLAQLQNDQQIATIEEDELAAPTLLESTNVIGAPQAWTSGFSGAGQTVVIIDTGVDKTHSFLSGKVVSEACYSTNNGTTATSVCPGGVTESTAVGSGVNCTTSISGCAHGTHVAGIAAGRGANFSGVAKDANIVAIQVFSKVDDATACGSSGTPCVLSYTSDQIKALERVKELASTMNIAAINMSLGGGQYSSSCDNVQFSRKTLIENLRSLGIATVVSSGNSSYTGALSAPACISSAISVGSTEDGGSGTTLDGVSSFSNSSAFLTLLAPGRWISSSVPGDAFRNYSGTSMASPHVAGAIAILKQRAPNATVSQFVKALVRSGQQITDSRNGITKPRIKIAQALDVLGKKDVPFDFDGDSKADFAVFRPSTASWYIQNSATNSFSGSQFGAIGDLTTAADFDGDGKTDISVFRNGFWYRLNSTDNKFVAIQFGSPGDIPVAGDFDGDGKADLAVFRPSDGAWYRKNSSNDQFVAQQFGSNGDKPQVGDFDGDSKIDLAVFRPSAGAWYILRSSDNSFYGVNFGTQEDIPTAADYDGDGKTDISVFRPSAASWYRLNSSNNQFYGEQFGIGEDKPVAADYDGDGKTDIAVFRASQGFWYVNRSASGFLAQQFGIDGDTPAPASITP
ncbi:MAG: S8 family serine peptidase [Acidobacteriota bacterium]|nr:S8 family serine peptidase [Acidobacteriota bacterium]